MLCDFPSVPFLVLILSYCTSRLTWRGKVAEWLCWRCIDTESRRVLRRNGRVEREVNTHRSHRTTNEPCIHWQKQWVRSERRTIEKGESKKRPCDVMWTKGEGRQNSRIEDRWGRMLKGKGTTSSQNSVEPSSLVFPSTHTMSITIIPFSLHSVFSSLGRLFWLYSIVTSFPNTACSVTQSSVTFRKINRPIHSFYER